MEGELGVGGRREGEEREEGKGAEREVCEGREEEYPQKPSAGEALLSLYVQLAQWLKKRQLS